MQIVRGKRQAICYESIWRSSNTKEKTVNSFVELCMVRLKKKYVPKEKKERKVEEEAVDASCG